MSFDFPFGRLFGNFVITPLTFVLFLLAIVLSVLRITDSDYPFDIFKLFYKVYISFCAYHALMFADDGMTSKTLKIVSDWSKIRRCINIAVQNRTCSISVWFMITALYPR